MSQVGRKAGATAARIIEHNKQFLGPIEAARREQQIANLPIVVWKDRQLYTIRCQGLSGNGPHLVNVPLALVWGLIDVNRYYCPYHIGDVWRDASDYEYPYAYVR